MCMIFLPLNWLEAARVIICSSICWPSPFSQRHISITDSVISLISLFPSFFCPAPHCGFSPLPRRPNDPPRASLLVPTWPIPVTRVSGVGLRILFYWWVSGGGISTWDLHILVQCSTIFAASATHPQLKWDPPHSCPLCTVGSLLFPH